MRCLFWKSGLTRSQLPIPARNPYRSSVVQPELLPQTRTPAWGRCRAGRTAFLSLHSHRVLLLRWRTPQRKRPFHSDNRASMTYPLYPSLLFMTANLFASIIAPLLHRGVGSFPSSQRTPPVTPQTGEQPRIRLCGRSLRTAMPNAFLELRTREVTALNVIKNKPE